MKNLLIVEDSFIDLNNFIPLFLRKGFNVLITRSGAEALKIIENSPPDIILLDVILPDISGFNVCQELKKKAATQKIPVVICSIRKSELEQFWGLKVGANAYLTKPVGQENLVSTIDRLVA
jgi:two-component system, chemotaxis family, response regulator PixH